MGSDRAQRGVSPYRSVRLCTCVFVRTCVCMFCVRREERGGARRVSRSLYGFIWLSLGRLT